MRIANRIGFVLVCAIALTAVPRADATSLVLPRDASLAAKSDLVVSGRALGSASVERDGTIWTETRIVVDERLKGASDGIVMVREPGGELGDRATVVFGAPEFAPGERVLLFLARTPGNGYRTIDLAAGKFSERVDSRGTRFWFRDLRRSGLRLLGSAAAPSATDLQREAVSFERAIRRGAPEESEYFSPFAAPDDGDIEASFAMAGPPRIHRWFSFDGGKPSPWASVGRQKAYQGGGLEELAIALAAWSFCPGTNVRYVFGGPSSAIPAEKAQANAANEVFFDDPLNEIQGTWNGRDGVLAVARFEAVRARAPWKPGFAADAAHPAESFDAWAIVEGDVVVQDGIAPSLGIRSGTLAETLAHELGHTLGLGHSSEPTALMYASLQHLGAYLRDDDRLAAQWLYPGAAVSADPSALGAPAKLAVAQVTSEFVRLTWSDNASGEAFQTIYGKAAGGPFAKLRDVAANVTVANLTGLVPEKSYAFRVTARTPAAESSPSNEVEVTIPRPDLVSSFTVGPLSGTAGITTFSFYDQSKGMIVSRQWSFGDGDASSDANPTHVYREAGAWVVTLRVRDDRGTEAVSARSVTAGAPPPLVPDFSWAPTAVTAGQPVLFADRSSGSPTRWSWSFGDGTGSSERDPSKTFATPGRYAISLEVARGLQTAPTWRWIEVAGGPFDAGPGTELVFSPEIAEVGEPVRFREAAPEPAERWLWDFGDGGSSSEPQPVHSYSVAGTYVVSLTVARGGRSAVALRLLVVRDENDPLHPFEGGAPKTSPSE